jgi:hypothetical protein
MIYLFVGLVIILLAYLEAIEKSRLSSTLDGGAVCLFLIFFAAFRDNVGTDWLAYYSFYVDTIDGVEPGYGFLNNFFSVQGAPYNLFLLFLNSLSLILFFISLKRYAIFFVISLLLFYCELYLYFNFSGIRQGMALSIIVYSVRFSIDRKILQFLLFIFLAMMFHYTSLIFLIAYFVPFREFTKKEYVLIAGMFLFLSTIIFFVANLLDGDLAHKAKYYLEWQENDPNIKLNYFIGAVKRSIIVVMIYVFGKKLLQTRNGLYFFNLYLIGFGMYLSTYLISPDIGTRMSSYFLIFEIFIAGNLILVNEKLTTRLLIVTIFTCQALYKISTYMTNEWFVYDNILF